MQHDQKIFTQANTLDSIPGLAFSGHHDLPNGRGPGTVMQSWPEEIWPYRF
jgi:hypothetical protein